VLLMMSVPAAVAGSTSRMTVRVAVDPAARLPKAHVPLAAPEYVPTLGVMESTDTPAGKVSDSLTSIPLASKEPPLVTVTM